MQRRLLLLAAGLAVAGLTAAGPPVSAAPSEEQPGAPCSVPGATSVDGTLTCSGQASIWMHRGMPFVEPGQPCDRPGDVTYKHGENLVTCRPSGSGLAWE